MHVDARDGMLVNQSLVVIARVFFILALVFPFVGMFVIPKGHEVQESLVILAIIAGAISYSHRDVDRSKYRDFFVFSLVFYGLVILFSNWVHGDWVRYGKTFLLVVIYCFLMPKLTGLKNYISYVVAAGGVLIGGVALYEWSSGVYRVDGFTNAIPFAQGAAIIFLFNCYFFIVSERPASKLVSFLGLLLSIVAIHLSQTRGVWLALLAVGFFLLVYVGFNISWKKMIAGLFLLILSCWVSYQLSDVVRSKVESAKSDLEKAASGDFNTSWGLRIVAWESAIKNIKENPVFGVGREHFYESKYRQVVEGIVNDLVLHPALAHAHNQYLHSALIRGFLGFLAVLIILVVPLVGRYRTRSLKLLMIAVVISFSVFSLSDVPFEHLNTIYLYLFSIILIRQVLDCHSRDADSSNHETAVA